MKKLYSDNMDKVLILDKLENWLNDQVDNKLIPVEERIIYSKVLDKLDQLYNE